MLPLKKIINKPLYTSFRYYSEAIVDKLKVEYLEGKDRGIVQVGIYRPTQKNSFNRALLQSFNETINAVKYDKNLRVMIIRSLVPKVFCAGADLRERKNLTPTEVRQFVDGLRLMMTSLENLPIPVIAAIDGVALGGGLELALACDIRIASSTAKLGLVETKLAIIPGAGGTQRLPRLINPSKAKELIFTARIFDGKEAYDLGIVNHVVEQNENYTAAFDKAMDIAREILPNGPIGVQMAKMAINEGIKLNLNSGLKVEELAYATLIPTKDRIEGLNAFNEKRMPNYIGE